MQNTETFSDSENTRLGAIDIGSNAVRLLIVAYSQKADTESRFQKLLFLRVPLRLGEDVFSIGKITPTRQKNLLHVANAFKHLLLAYNVSTFRACATAAMREAKNRTEIVTQIKKETGVQIDVLDGTEEAKIICESHAAESLNPSSNYIYVDVGGGSTEISLLRGQKIQFSRSFNIGTLRTLARKVESSEWERLDAWLHELRNDSNPLEIIGSGGNINKLYRMAKIEAGKKLSVTKLKNVAEKTKKLSVAERIERLGMRPDRADVIVPAAEIFLHIAASANIRYLNVPTIGLADGIVHHLTQK